MRSPFFYLLSPGLRKYPDKTVPLQTGLYCGRLACGKLACGRLACGVAVCVDQYGNEEALTIQYP